MIFYIPYLHIKKEFKENVKEWLINIYGWSGTLSTIMAYGLTSFNVDKKIFISILNIYGSFAIGYICYRSKATQAVVCEILWCCIAIYSLINNLLENENAVENH
jgi:hypothetical protein